ncbi:SanA/YdcF family protein [Demequina sediminicola]|uniref:SanA/YdcF family protein n=1 Tax=Demequina sediminicola TaxID=1095026 RepID=UPI000780AA4C|nr:YdcF family protein [Demequina sediminicola]
MPRLASTLALTAAAASAALVAPQVYARASARGDVHLASSGDFAPADAALVLGARVWPDGRPSRFLRERVATGAELYHRGDVNLLFLTGAGHNREGLDETKAMHTAARELGVPDEALVKDPHGYDTRESARNAWDAGVSSVIVCSQEFHLPRAMWLCRSVGLDVQGAHPPVLSTRWHTARGYVREVPATWKAALEIAHDAL